MKSVLYSRSLYVTLALIVITIVIAMVLGVGKRPTTPLVTTTVETGTVQQLIFISGVADALDVVDLGFPVTGTVEEVRVRAGTVVEAGDVIAVLDTRTLQADKRAAEAELKTALANRAELIAGPTAGSRAVNDETVRVRAEALAATKAAETAKVTNAYRTLLSSQLSAYTSNPNERATPPTISGTYTCDTEGTYTIRVFSSDARSGISFTLSGLETGTYVGAIEQPSPLGTCGLQILFDRNSIYHNSTWTVPVPNVRSTNYTANKNVYDLAKTQASTAITLAEQELALAEVTAINNVAPARNEALARADASVIAAEARLSRVNTSIEERTLRAPFNGTITAASLLVGETVGTTPVVTLLATETFEVTARIPEINMGNVRVGQKVLMRFDAKDDELLTGEIDFIALKATLVDGVAYFDARITLDTAPEWMRSGLNADVEIITAEATNVLRVPKRFIQTTDGISTVRVYRDTTIATSTVSIVFDGNDGFTAITGVTEGDILVAP